MEQEMKKDWFILKGILQKSEQKTKNRPYLTNEEMEAFERKMKNALRMEKLGRILKFKNN